MNIYIDRPQFVLGFHGCEEETRDKILNSPKEHLSKSINDYDWLGSGVYFWLNDPQRAMEWAKRKDKKGMQKLKNPAVIGTIIDLKHCLNFAERECIEIIQTGYELFRAHNEITELENKAPDDGGFTLLRNLDCAIINYTCELLKKEGQEVNTVMGYFQESTPAYTGAGIRAKSHIQLCVRDVSCIKGYFMPRE